MLENILTTYRKKQSSNFIKINSNLVSNLLNLRANNLKLEENIIEKSAKFVSVTQNHKHQL